MHYIPHHPERRSAKTSGNTVTGPLWKRTFAYNWEREREAPYWTDAKSGPLLFAGDGLCPLEANITFQNTVRHGVAWPYQRYRT